MTDQTQTRMTRREALKGGSAAAVAAGAYLMQEQLVQAAAAQTNEPRIQLGQDYVIDDDPDGNGDLVIEHLPSGAEFRYDSSVDAWVPTGQIGDGTTSANHGSVTTGEVDVTTQTGFTLTPIQDFTSSFSGGQTKTMAFGNSTPSVGSLFFPIAVPDSDPDNDVGFEVSAIQWDDSDGSMKIEVTETENAGGGTARIATFEIQVV